MAAYHSPYYAELYDLSLSQTPWVCDDAAIYLDAYKQMRSLRPQDPSHDYLVLDVGTGTGRVFRHIAEYMIQEKISPDDMRFIGVDISPHMISRAKEMVPKSLASRITYTVGSALDLQAIEGLQGPPKVDLLIFAYASISLLSEPGAAEQFLRQVVKVLRPGTGRAYIPIGYLFDDGRQSEADKINQRYADTPARADIPSKKYPNVIYRFPEGYMATRREGNVVTYAVSMQVVEKGPGGQERVIEGESSTNSARIWGDGEFLLEAQMAGLQLVEAKRTFNETSYVFCVA
jgi:SAM-dependent methyltransferase